jgi:hypothetical protein
VVDRLESACEHDTPRRGNQRALASRNQAKAAERWKYGEKEGNMPIPMGAVVTIAIDSVDRGPSDIRR